MGLGDEIMALGRAEALFEKTGKPVAICNDLNLPRFHEAWVGNPAWDAKSSQKIIDGAGCRPYIKHWQHRKAVYNLDYRPRAGRIYLKPEELAYKPACGNYAVISPHIKTGASVNKAWGAYRWEKVIQNFPIPVYQCLYDTARPIDGAIGIKTPHFRHAAGVISGARLVLTNEGGSHHLAASFRIPAVVIFGSFTPPQVTGYDFHINVSRETPHGYCGMWDYCPECEKALASITPDEVRSHCVSLLEKDADFGNNYSSH